LAQDEMTVAQDDTVDFAPETFPGYFFHQNFFNRVIFQQIYFRAGI